MLYRADFFTLTITNNTLKTLTAIAAATSSSFHHHHTLPPNWVAGIDSPLNSSFSDAGEAPNGVSKSTTLLVKPSRPFVLLLY